MRPIVRFGHSDSDEKPSGLRGHALVFLGLVRGELFGANPDSQILTFDDALGTAPCSRPASHREYARGT